MSEIILSDPQGVVRWGGASKPPSRSRHSPLRLGARIRLTSHEGRSFMVRLFLMRNPWAIIYLTCPKRNRADTLMGVYRLGLNL